MATFDPIVPPKIVPTPGEQRIGNCRVVGEIGSGGMAVVYKAIQEPLSRTVAIKALKSVAASEPNFLVRFEREAVSVAALQHENIITVYDFHRENGLAYIVMEFVEGIDLFDLLEKAVRLPPDVAAIIALQIARALDHAHYRSIIHRDIKPANIMVANNGGVKLMDFGIARDQSFGDLTKDGTGLGTPSYMSPEQVLGDKVDFTSDIFSLGIVLYQMVCGRKPFIEDEHRSVLQKIRLDRPIAPRRLSPVVPRELERIIDRCLEKKPEDRYRSTQDLVVALEQFLVPRVEMNYRARVVLYLSDLGIIAADEASRHLHPAAAGGYQQGESRGPRLRRVALGQGMVLGAMALAIGLLHLSPLGAPRAQPAGFVRVLVDPWAEVYVDGKLAGTTPLPRPLALAEGRHRIEMKNPHFAAPEWREVEVQRGVTQTLKVALKK